MTILCAEIAGALLIVVAGREPVWAESVCDVPAAFSLAVEERPLLDTGNAGLVVAPSIARSSPLRAGDVIRQANGRRAIRCSDLEGAAAEALAKGLVLLLAAERDGKLVAVVVPASMASAPVEAPAMATPPADVMVRAPSEGERTPPPPPRPPPPLPRPTPPLPTATPIPHREAALPARADAPAELAAKTVAAAAVLGTVGEAARLTVPLATYERRLDEAKNAIAALRIEGEGASQVRAVVAEALGYYEAARDIRRYKAAELSHARVDQRGAAAISLPYFSESEVPRWVERYPFLSETLQQAPRSTHLLLPGEMPGRWNPDQAVELLWERAGTTVARLGAWAAGR